MHIHIDNKVYLIDVPALEADLEAQNMKLQCISRAGELVIDDEELKERGNDYFRVVYQFRQPGEGTNNETWGGGEWEFCRSIKMTVE